MTTDAASDHHVTVRYWAAARAAAGVASDTVPGRTVAEALDAAIDLHPALHAVAGVATVLVDGVAAARDRSLPPGATVELLPPFAGG